MVRVTINQQKSNASGIMITRRRMKVMSCPEFKVPVENNVSVVCVVL